MRGDLADIVFRLRSVLPKRWFAEQSPNLEAVLGSLATPWVWLYGLIHYVIMQTRLLTATDDWLDLISNDYFGAMLGRKPNEADFTFRSRIQRALLQEAATRSAVSAGLENLTGSPPIIFEPANCMDTGSYGGQTDSRPMPGTGMAYGVAGGWGNLQLPLQVFVTVTRPATPGLGMLAGYGTTNGAYREGAISYVDLSLLPGHVSDADIRATLCSLLPINAVAWLRLI
ncbi:hypothetical protein [Rhodopila sp.]|uniref:hypothetical protein n=1 Tax=Rhodopila sp. TaxID=2480087 RepID=UPI003D0BFC13